MINIYDRHKFINKSTLAQLAGVSSNTFRRYLNTRRDELEALGVSPRSQKLPPQAVHYICEDYCIDLPPELQDQEVLSRSPLYQQFIHHLQDAEQCRLRLKVRGANAPGSGSGKAPKGRQTTGRGDNPC